MADHRPAFTPAETWATDGACRVAEERVYQSRPPGGETPGRQRRSSIDRREFIGTGLTAVALGLVGPRAAVAQPPAFALPGTGYRRAQPIRALRPVDFADSITVGGYAFSSRFAGDWPEQASHPPLIPIGTPPTPNESAELVIVGGGISGLAAAYHLSEFNPVVLERLDRFGGASQGERWLDTDYSLGGAYFISPDEGSSLDTLYLELGLDRLARIDEEPGPAELRGQFIEDFFNSAAIPPEDRPAFETYMNLVRHYADNYPDIPLPAEDFGWILDLDRITLKDHVEHALGGPAPELLAAAIQSYCFSSFGGGWQEISAAAGWNFIAAEEYGRWVLPGGNAGFAQALWERLSRRTGPGGRPSLRTGCSVHDVRLNPAGALVTYTDPSGDLRSIQARKVVLSCPKYMVKFIVHDLASLDHEKRDALDHLDYRAYIVANVLVHARLQRDFYDLFLLGDGVYPRDTFEAEAFSRATDVVTGHFARRGNSRRSVLTLYWPLPWDTARFTLTPIDSPLEVYSQRLAARLDFILDLLHLPKRAVEQVRLVRWGHALPLARPGFLAEGLAELVRRPIDDTIFFVEQDNWALPAIETCLLEAEAFAPAIAHALRGR